MSSLYRMDLIVLFILIIENISGNPIPAKGAGTPESGRVGLLVKASTNKFVLLTESESKVP